MSNPSPNAEAASVWRGYSGFLLSFQGFALQPGVRLQGAKMKKSSLKNLVAEGSLHLDGRVMWKE